MKTKIIVLGMALSLFLTSCNKDEDNKSANTFTAAEVKENAEMDNISDDVAYLTESQSDESPAGRSPGRVAEFLGPCAEVTTEVSDNIWTRTIDFGTDGCTLFNGNTVRGKIIITFTNDFDAETRSVSYAFDNFYHNDRHVEGNRSLVRTKVDGHPKSTISLDMTVTTSNGIYHRTGQRVREFTAGYNSFFNLYDNEFTITGNWTTTFPNGNTQSTAITNPLIEKWNCLHIVSGTITFTRNANSAVLDYGDGSCDDDATIIINGIVYPVDLGF